ncbi:hypothetical protein OCK74_27125 [Chitinophagaceae bacterium LB-8]|uniref:Uncharacterized protein n=1 Tax=Paraflavisolibacter caeni TaxID=2982496 RepID=A0A9X2Y0D1_9BACT|nr:hypothetical protein [Paraflavisolibacter caeni]MCU7552821.1 hypothetical protein [Paraflavisolibacter caeni]
MKYFTILSAILVLLLAACNKEHIPPPDGNEYKPDVSPENFTNSTHITNPWTPYELQKKYIYEGKSVDGQEKVEEQRLNSTKKIMGITCIEVNFKEYDDGKLVEETIDRYAQDNNGTFWYFGESVNNYNPDGTLKDHEGSWEAGVDGAQPGIIMLANPIAGITYREEYYLNQAEDKAEILETGITVTTLLGTFNNCIKTKNYTRLEPDVIEYKYYAPGYGVIKEVNQADKEEIFLTAIQ